MAAHTDSPVPCLKPDSLTCKVKEDGNSFNIGSSETRSDDFTSIGVELYGGGLWHTWFDRDLSVAGRVVVKFNNPENNSELPTFKTRLLKIDRPIIRLPMLAIHLQPEIRQNGFKPNHQSHIHPILSASSHIKNMGKQDGAKKISHPIINLMKSELMKDFKCKENEFEICDFHLNLFDTQKSCSGGLDNEFIYSARLDNQTMCFCILTALINSSCDLEIEDWTELYEFNSGKVNAKKTGSQSLENDENLRIIAMFDNEEIGSTTERGANSRFFMSVLENIHSAFETNSPMISLNQALDKSIMVSCDMAHAVHPNYPDKHDPNYKVKLHKGPVLKHSINQSFATNDLSAFFLKQIASKYSIPVQQFANRNDVRGGQTLGPLLASQVSIRTVDLGVPQLAMHSIREMCAIDDVEYSICLLSHFFQDYPNIFQQIKFDRFD